jgi:hypothetical protein
MQKKFVLDGLSKNNIPATCGSYNLNDFSNSVLKTLRIFRPKPNTKIFQIGIETNLFEKRVDEFN